MTVELGKYFETESLGNDQYQTTIGIKSINYQDAGIWKRNNDNWVDSGIGDRPHIVTSAPFMVSVSPDGLRRIHPTREDDVWFEMSGAKINQAGTWNVVPLGTPTSRVNNRITWNRTNFNAYMDMAGHYVKLGYLLKNGYLPPNNQFAYEVATNGLTREGGTLLKDGVPVMRMRKPIAYDYDNPDDVRQIAHEIVRIDGKWHVVFTLPSLAGMSKPLIDPTLELQPDASAGEDTRIFEDAKTYNYGIKTEVISGCVPGFISKILIDFDVTSLPAGATISTAVLYLVWQAQGVGGTTVSTHKSLVEWYEGEKDGAVPGATDGSTWNHRNANTGGQVVWTGGTGGVSGTEYAATASDDVVVNGAGTYNWDVKSIVEDWVTTNYGLWMIASGNSDYVKFQSSDYATAADRPKLVVDWTAAGVPTHMDYYRRRHIL